MRCIVVDQGMASPQLPPRAEDAVASLKRPHEDATEGVKKTKQGEDVIVDNSGVLADVARFPRRSVGTVEYLPHQLLVVGRELYYNCELQVRVSAYFLREKNDLVERRALWGTDVYTDDSDLLAVLRHMGFSCSANHDLAVKLLLLPSLKQYQGSFRHGISSRNWITKHDGISYMVLGEPKKMPRGWATGNRGMQPERLQALRELRDQAKAPVL